MPAIYREIGRARRWLRDQLGNQERQDNLILLVGIVAAGGIVAIQFFWGLPA